MSITTLDLKADIIDIRDVIARFEELETLLPETEQEKWENCDEYATLLELLNYLCGSGGDEQWRDDWYPVTLIADHHFTDYARELLQDCGDIPQNLPHYIEIDWETTARNIRVDYSPVEINGATYWYR